MGWREVNYESAVISSENVARATSADGITLLLYLKHPVCDNGECFSVPYEGIGTVLVGREGFDIEQRCRPIVEGAELEVIYEQFGSARIT